MITESTKTNYQFDEETYEALKGLGYEQCESNPDQYVNWDYLVFISVSKDGYEISPLKRYKSIEDYEEKSKELDEFVRKTFALLGEQKVESE